jgi:hypothetical protein
MFDRLLAEGRVETLWWPERRLFRSRGIEVQRMGDPGDSNEPHRALVARALVRLDDAVFDAVPREHAGLVALARCELSYERARTYVDRGMVKGSIGIRDETPFLIAMERPDRFRFEYLSGHPHERRLSMRGVVWCDGAEARSWWTLAPTVEVGDCDRFLGAFAGVSHGSSSMVPRLLRFRTKWGGRLTVESGVGAVEPDTLGGRPCWKVTTGLPGEVTVHWIDAGRWLLLRTEEREYPSMTTYDPVIDGPVDASWFTFDPDHQERSPLQDPALRAR